MKKQKPATPSKKSDQKIKKERTIGTSTKPQKHGKKLKIVAIVLSIIILGLAYLYLTYGSIPSALLSGKQVNATEIEAIMFQKLNSTDTVGLTYSGSVVINNTDPNLSISYLKYYNDTKTVFSFTDFPVLGNVSDIVISLNNATSGYSCIKSWNSTASDQNPYVCSNATGVTDSRIGYALGLIVQGSSLSNITVNSYGVSLWNLQPCYSVGGTGSIMVNGVLIGSNGYVPSNFNFTSCVSAQYDVPYTLQGVLSLGNNHFIHVNIHETEINFTTTQNQVVSLPNQT